MNIPGLELHWWHYPAVLIVGFFSGFLNSAAGGGSMLSLPLLIFLGLPPSAANGTNRLAVAVGALGAVSGFHKKHVTTGLDGWKAGIFAGVGAFFGSISVLHVPDSLFRFLLAFVLIAISINLILQAVRPSSGNPKPAGIIKIAIVNICIGFYGGFLQVGAAFIFIFALTRMYPGSLVKINALKTQILVSFLAVSIAVFAWNGQIHWVLGAVLAAGFWLGGWSGSNWQNPERENQIRGLLVLTGIGMAIKLVWDFFPA